MDYQVQVELVAPQSVAVLREVLPSSAFSTRVPAMMGTVWNYLKANGIEPRGRNVAIYRPVPGGMEVESGVEVGRVFEGSEGVLCTSTPGGTVATVAHIGLYRELRRAHESLRQWCLSTGRKPAGISWEVYGHWTQEADAAGTLRTDVYWLLA